MKPSQIIKEIKEALKLTKKDLIKIYELEEFPLTNERLQSILNPKHKKDEATYEELGVFLDGLISLKRGKIPREYPHEIILDNNLILKKLRAALNLKEFEIALIFELADFPIRKSKIKDMFRSPLNKKYKECDDKTLKAFLKGLKEFYFDVPI